MGSAVGPVEVRSVPERIVKRGRERAGQLSLVRSARVGSQDRSHSDLEDPT